jgi:hypothetical protein
VCAQSTCRRVEDVCEKWIYFEEHALYVLPIQRSQKRKSPSSPSFQHEGTVICLISSDESNNANVCRYSRKNQKRLSLDTNSTTYSISYSCTNPSMNGRRRSISRHVLTAYTFEILTTAMQNISKRRAQSAKPLNSKDCGMSSCQAMLLVSL